MKKMIIIVQCCLLLLPCWAISPSQLKKARANVYDWVRDYDNYCSFQGKYAAKHFLELFQNDTVIVYDDCFPQKNHDFYNPYVSAAQYVDIRVGENLFDMKHKLSNVSIVSELLSDDNNMLDYTIEITKEVSFTEKDNREDSRYEYPPIVLIYVVYLSYDIKTELLKATGIQLSERMKPIEPFLIIHSNTDNSYTNEKSVDSICKALSSCVVTTTYINCPIDDKIVEIKSDTMKNTIGVWGNLGVDLAKYELLSPNDFANWDSKIRKNCIGLGYLRQLMLKNKNRLSLEVGLGVQFGKFNLKFDYKDTCLSVDPDAGIYERRVSLQGYEECIKTIGVILPVTFRYDYLATKNIMLFARAGFDLNYTFLHSSSAQGEMYNQGYYDWLFNVTMSQEGIYDFGRSSRKWTTKTTALGFFDADLTLGLGLSVCIKSFSIDFSVNYRGTVFSSMKAADDYHLSNKCESWTSVSHAYKKINSNVIYFQLQFNHLF